MSIELNFPEYDPKDARWQAKKLGKRTVHIMKEESSTPGFETYWRVENDLLPNCQTRIDHYKPNQSSRKIERLSMPLEAGIVAPPLITCSLTVVVEGLPQSITINSGGYTWKESSVRDGLQSEHLTVEFAPSGNLSKASLETVRSSNQIFNTEFDFIGLSQDRIGYTVSSFDMPNIGEVFKELKSSGSASISAPRALPTLAEGTASLGVEFSLFRSVHYSIDTLPDFQFLTITISRRHESDENRTDLLIPTTTLAGKLPTLEDACFAEPSEWQNLIGESLFRN